MSDRAARAQFRKSCLTHLRQVGIAQVVGDYAGLVRCSRVQVDVSPRIRSYHTIKKNGVDLRGVGEHNCRPASKVNSAAAAACLLEVVDGAFESDHVCKDGCES